MRLPNKRLKAGGRSPVGGVALLAALPFYLRLHALRPQGCARSLSAIR